MGYFCTFGINVAVIITKAAKQRLINMDNEISHIELQGWKPQEFELVFEFEDFDVNTFNETYLRQINLIKDEYKIIENIPELENGENIIKVLGDDKRPLLTFSIASDRMQISYKDFELTNEIIEKFSSLLSVTNTDGIYFQGSFHLFHDEAKQKLKDYFYLIDDIEFNIIRYKIGKFYASIYPCSQTIIHLNITFISSNLKEATVELNESNISNYLEIMGITINKIML